jgi:hypothetical protein
MNDEKRRRTRAPVHVDVSVRIAQETLRVETENISLNGMLCKPDRRLRTGETGDVRILLSPETVITARAKILRSDDVGMAIAFASLDDDSFFHLKRLVQFNTEDADLIDRGLQKAGF